jgi:hypothetical protein
VISLWPGKVRPHLTSQQLWREARDRRIRSMHEATGLRHCELAERFCLSKSRITQILGGWVSEGGKLVKRDQA